MSVTTTNGTETTLATFTPVGDSFATFDFEIHGRTAAGVSAAFLVRAAVKSVSGTASLVGSVAALATQKDAGASTWAATADVSGNTLRVRVTGAAATTVEWVILGPRGTWRLVSERWEES